MCLANNQESANVAQSQPKVVVRRHARAVPVNVGARPRCVCVAHGYRVGRHVRAGSRRVRGQRSARGMGRYAGVRQVWGSSVGNVVGVCAREPGVPSARRRASRHRGGRYANAIRRVGVKLQTRRVRGELVTGMVKVRKVSAGGVPKGTVFTGSRVGQLVLSVNGRVSAATTVFTHGHSRQRQLGK